MFFLFKTHLCICCSVRRTVVSTLETLCSPLSPVFDLCQARRHGCVGSTFPKFSVSNVVSGTHWCRFFSWASSMKLVGGKRGKRGKVRKGPFTFGYFIYLQAPHPPSFPSFPPCVHESICGWQWDKGHWQKRQDQKRKDRKRKELTDSPKDQKQSHNPATGNTQLQSEIRLGCESLEKHANARNKTQEKDKRETKTRNGPKGCLVAWPRSSVDACREAEETSFNLF